jgi:integrase
MALNDAKVKAAKPRDRDYKLADAGQLYLLVTKAGGRLWRMNYTYGGNAKGGPAQKTLTLGSYPSTSLSEARNFRDAAKALLRDGKDPAIERRLAVDEQAAANENTFETVAIRWFELNSGWSLERFKAWQAETGLTFAKQQARRWVDHETTRWSLQQAYDTYRSLERDIFPYMGDLPIASIRAPKVLKVLQEVERRGAIGTAHKLRQRVSAVFSYAVNTGLCENDPAGKLGAALKEKPTEIPQPSIVDGIKDWGSRITAVRQMLIDCEALRTRATTKLALRLLALTAVRPGELAGAMWGEFSGLDGDAPLWTIPAERMKGTRSRKAEENGEHLVALSRQAVDVLTVLRALTGRFPYCFPSERSIHVPLSENTIRAFLIRGGYEGRHVPHGFRAAFSTIMNERPRHMKHEDDGAIVDLMLAHIPERKSGSEGAYNRAAHMERRHELAQEYADLILGGFWPADIHLGQPMRMGRRKRADLAELAAAMAQAA